MPGDGQHQSAYRYRHTRQGFHHDASENSVAKTTPTTKQCEDDAALSENLPRIDTTRLANDPFLGTVAGRLAQEIHDEFLVCKICFDSYTNPKCLACLHTFCAKCIEKHISAEVTYNKYTDYRDFTCPLCRKRTQLPLGGVKRLPDNFLISGLTDLVLRQRASSNGSSTATIIGSPTTPRNNTSIDNRQVSSNVNESIDSLHQLPSLERKPLRYGECEICSQVSRGDRGHSSEPLNKINSSEINGNNSATTNNTTNGYNSSNQQQRASSANLSHSPKATSKCLDCNKLLCDECVQRHRNTKVTKDHSTFELQSHSEIECKDHPGETVRFYCDACSLCICVLCTFNTHREHEVTSFGEAVTKLRHELSRNLDVTCQRIGKVQSQMHDIREAADTVSRIEQRIHDTAEHFIEEIQRHEQELINELHQFIGERNMRQIQNQPDQEHHIEIAENLFKDIANSLDNQDMELLLARTTLYQKIAELNQLNLITEKFNPITAQIYFRPGSVNLGYLTNEMTVKNMNTVNHDDDDDVVDEAGDGDDDDDDDNDDDDDDEENYEDLSMPLECASSSSSSPASSLELANRPCINSTACQTDITLSDINESKDSCIYKLHHHEQQNGDQSVSSQPAIKQYRTRACNTDTIATVNQETNTRPRGIHTIITYSDISSNTTSEEYLAKLDTDKLNLNDMDNLTRARVRRKLHERFNTFDQIPNGNSYNSNSSTSNNNNNNNSTSNRNTTTNGHLSTITTTSHTSGLHFSSNGPSPARSTHSSKTTTVNPHRNHNSQHLQHHPQQQHDALPRRYSSYDKRYHY